MNQFPSQNMLPIVQSIPQSVQSQQKPQNYGGAQFNQFYGNQPVNNVMVQPQYQPQYQASTQPQIPMISSVKPTIETSNVQVHISKTAPTI